MKTRLIILAVAIAGGLSLGLFRASADSQVSAGVSIHSTAEFNEPLASGGTWVEVGSYGHCWRPAGVAAGWRPYCDGYWEWTDCGWYWISDEPWAWACYHYGTWVYDPDFGWVWVPGVEWAPAWVNWRIGGDYIGWAPCGPAGYTVAPSFYVFVESRNFHERVRPGNVIVNNTLIINKTMEISANRRENRKFGGRKEVVMINEGPRVDLVEKATGKQFTTVSVREADRQTSASIPEKMRHRTAEPVSEQPKPTPGAHPEMPNNLPPERTIPQAPPGTVIPPANKELPLDKRPPKEINPPQQAQTVPPGPVKPSEKDQTDDNNKDDKNHSHENP